MNGNERLWWAEDVTGYTYLTHPDAPPRKGFQRFSTTTPSEMDRIFAKIDLQEKQRYAAMTEAIFLKQTNWIEANRRSIRQMLSESRNPQEKDFLRAWLKAFDNKMDKLLKNTVYGVSAMQTEAAPIPVKNKTFTAEELKVIQ